MINLKKILSSTNLYLDSRRIKREALLKQASLSPPLPSSLLIKHYLKLVNKIMIGLNSFHIFRKEWIACAIGMCLGYAASEIDDFLSQFTAKYTPKINNALIEHILRSKDISYKLEETLDCNVFRNGDIQYQLHQLLTFKAINPNIPQLNQLIKSSILHSLKDEQVTTKLKQQSAGLLLSQEKRISSAAFAFLQSPTMDAIVANGLTAILRGQFFQNLMAKYFVYLVSTELEREYNREKLYEVLRQKFLLW